MDSEILDQAIRLGLLVEKDSATDLGKFGMGLTDGKDDVMGATHPDGAVGL
jgi:hypothetical protein